MLVICYVLSFTCSLLQNLYMPASVCWRSLDTLFIANNSPTKWTIENEICTIRKLFKIHTNQPKTASFAKNTKKLWDLRKNYPYIYTRQLFDYSYSTLNILNCQFMVMQHSCSPVYCIELYKFSLIDLISILYGWTGSSNECEPTTAMYS